MSDPPKIVTEPVITSCNGYNKNSYTILGSLLNKGSKLKSCDALLSKDQIHIFVLQSDGNLVLYNTINGRVLWASDTVSGYNNTKKLPFSFIYQGDSNLVLYDANGSVVWSTGTENKANTTMLELGNDGNLVLRENDKIIWCTGFYFVPTPTSQGELKFNYQGYKWLDGKDGKLTITGSKSNDVNQQWYINYNTGLLMNAGSGKCIDYNNDNGAFLNNCDNNNSNQKITLRNRKIVYGLGTELISNCLDVGSSKFTWPCQNWNENQLLI